MIYKILTRLVYTTARYMMNTVSYPVHTFSYPVGYCRWQIAVKVPIRVERQQPSRDIFTLKHTPSLNVLLAQRL
jgi:hypothetical protein